MFYLKQTLHKLLIGCDVILKLQSSDDEDLKAEEEEVLRLQAAQAGSITAADAGLDDDSEEESDRELTMEVVIGVTNYHHVIGLYPVA